MQFTKTIPVNKPAVLRALGYGNTSPDAATAALLHKAAALVQAVACPRWAAVEQVILPGCMLKGSGLVLAGQDIALHLAGCARCVLLGLTLGAELERETRAAEAADIGLAVMLDTAASTLAEQYADMAEQQLRQEVGVRGLYLTGRYSPGYGDLPITLQREIVRLLDGPRAIGLTVGSGGILLPRKSITAILGLADHPVRGHLAGCENCALRASCKKASTGGNLPCAKN